MGFPKTHATSILNNVFKVGNKIALLSAVDTDADTYAKVSGTGYADYTIQTGDFTTTSGVTTTARHILFGLAEGEGGWGTAVGFAVYSGTSLTSSTLLYLGKLVESKPIGKDTVPVFKKYAVVDGVKEGIRVTLDVVDESSVNVNGAS